jgi:hypothetical protein
MKKTTKSTKICLPRRSCRLAKTGVNPFMKKYPVNPVILSKKVILSDAKVANTGCQITMLILQNEPNFRCFSPKNKDSTKKQTQFKPNFTCPDAVYRGTQFIPATCHGVATGEAGSTTKTDFLALLKSIILLILLSCQNNYELCGRRQNEKGHSSYRIR